MKELPPIALVFWEDVSRDAEWHSQNSPSKTIQKVAGCASIGFIAGETESGILLASTCPDLRVSEAGGDHWGSFMKLPKGMIYERWQVKQVVKK